MNNYNASCYYEYLSEIVFVSFAMPRAAVPLQSEYIIVVFWNILSRPKYFEHPYSVTYPTKKNSTIKITFLPEYSDSQFNIEIIYIWHYDCLIIRPTFIFMNTL